MPTTAELFPPIPAYGIDCAARLLGDSPVANRIVSYLSPGALVTTVDAYMRNYKVFFMADAVGATSAEGHDMTLRWVAETSGQIALAGDVVRQLEGGS